MHRRPHRTRRARPPVPGTRAAGLRTPPVLAPLSAPHQRAACAPGPLPGGDRGPAAARPAAAPLPCRSAGLRNTIGITAQTAEQWPPSPRPRPHAEALTHARTWASEHGHLCPPIKTVHDGFPLGEWLNRQRELAKKRSSPSPTQQALATIDPWWNPPWPILWQRAYHHAHIHRHTPAIRQWLQPTAATYLAPPPPRPTTPPHHSRPDQRLNRSGRHRRHPSLGGRLPSTSSDRRELRD
ncbi:helicase associated domain-containing protein [Streptomyces sp. LUP30]|uniref:helicase associated domain-containing protein n=1 Tax=Streptomyces sp. LUP30 TaxID=1890285 RepID=UPI00210C2580|nr:helicase associated domain-containing protein [Streptomyces sp. LUP30]